MNVIYLYCKLLKEDPVMWMNNKECTINRINNAVANIVDKVGKHYIKEHEELIQVIMIKEYMEKQKNV